jgi:hypothetical protein
MLAWPSGVTVTIGDSLIVQPFLLNQCATSIKLKFISLAGLSIIQTSGG